MDTVNKFSTDVKNVISHARVLALALGYNHVNSIHFLLADCELNLEHSIKNFLFTNHQAYENFKNNFALEKPDGFEEKLQSLPLTKEAEYTLRLALKEIEVSGDVMVYPCHLFTAALRMEGNFIYELLKVDGLALQKLVKYYNNLYENLDVNNVKSNTLVFDKNLLPKI
jgi:ATP-dependent Clp protease ATP-binding subunit ClpA